jgi:NADH-quinone oxidoreductase subunit L
MPTTYWTFLVATLALAGIPVFSGFFSKDEILGRVFAAGVGNLHGYGKVYLGLWVLGVVGAFLTAFYMFRAVHMTFSGSFRGPEASWHHAHESPPVMTWPLRILGVGSVVVGFVGVGKALSFGADINLFEHFLEKSLPNLELAHHPSLATEWALITLSVGVAGLGLWLAGRWYTGPQAFTVPEKLAQTFPRLATLLANKYYVDEIYQASVVAGTLGLSRASFAFDTKVVDGAVNGVRHLTVGTSFFSGFFDLHVVDGLVNLVAKIYRLGSEGLRRVQWGLVQGYALIMTVGFVAALVAAWMLWH